MDFKPVPGTQQAVKSAGFCPSKCPLPHQRKDKAAGEHCGEVRARRRRNLSHSAQGSHPGYQDSQPWSSGPASGTCFFRPSMRRFLAGLSRLSTLQATGHLLSAKCVPGPGHPRANDVTPPPPRPLHYWAGRGIASRRTRGNRAGHRLRGRPLTGFLARP